MSNSMRAVDGGGRADTICIVSKTKCAKIRIDDIEYLEQDGRKLHIITESEDYEVYESINMIAEYLVERGFYRPMKGAIINFDRVKAIEDYYVVFESGREFAMGKNNICRTRKAFRRYVLQYPPYMNWEPVLKVSERDIRDISEAETDEQ